MSSKKIQKKISELLQSDPALRKAKEHEFERGLLPSYLKIGRYRSDAYARFKYTKNQLAGQGNVDLINTGATVNSMFVKTGGGGFIFDSKTSYWPDLIKKYGYSIQGLNQGTVNKIQKENHLPVLRKYINEELGLR